MSGAAEIAEAIRESSASSGWQTFADIGTGLGGFLTAVAVSVAVGTYFTARADRRRDAASVLHVVETSAGDLHTVTVRNVGDKPAVVESVLPASPLHFITTGLTTAQAGFLLDIAEERVVTLQVQSLLGGDPDLHVQYACFGYRWRVRAGGGQPVQVD